MEPIWQLALGNICDDIHALNLMSKQDEEDHEEQKEYSRATSYLVRMKF